MASANASRSRGAFTLMEVLVVMALMSLFAGAMAPMAAGQIRGQRVRETTARMQSVMLGMLGDPNRGGHGYLGDLGVLPASLEDLNRTAGMPTFAVDGRDGVGTGYNGPYVPQIGASRTPFIDAWGVPFEYTQGVPQIRSAGADRAFDTADDLVHPVAVPVVEGNLTVTVTGVPNDSGTPCLLSEDEADVFVALSNQGERIESQLVGRVAAGGPFLSGGLHKGFHGLRLAGEGDFAGASVIDVMELRGGSSQLRVTLIQPSGHAPACGGTGTGSGSAASSADSESSADSDSGSGGGAVDGGGGVGRKPRGRTKGRSGGRGRRSSSVSPVGTHLAGASIPGGRG